LDPLRVRIAFGLTAIIVLVLSIIDLRVKWKETATNYGGAAQQLGNLKGKYRNLYATTHGADPKKNARLGREYARVMKTLPPIPDRLFNRLKADHNFKKALSQRISANPRAPEWFLRLQLRAGGIRQALRGEKRYGATGE
jgi:hypothetical protein